MKCVILGDKGCGKSSLALTFLLGKCPEVVNEDSFTSYTKYFDGVKVEVQVSCKINYNNPDQCQEFFKDIDAVLLCFAVDDPSSFESVQQYWFHVVREHAAHANFFLVGCKMDMLPYSELSAGTVLLTPSLLLRSPTITSIKNTMNGHAMNGTISKSPAPSATPDPRSPPSREATETNSLPPLREDRHMTSRGDTALCNGNHVTTRDGNHGDGNHGDGKDVATRDNDHVITRDLGKNLASQLGCVDYIECSVKEEFNGPGQVTSLFTKVVNRTRRNSLNVNSVGNSRACVIL